jgi:hypothetical protein
MAFAPFASWNSRSIIHLPSSPSLNLPMNSSDESNLEEDVATRGQGRPERRDHPEGVTHRLWSGQQLRERQRSWADAALTSHRHFWNSPPTTLASPKPASPKSCATPTGNRGGLDKDQLLSPPRPQPLQAEPEQTVVRAEASIRTSEDAKLVAQGENLRRGGRSV